MHSELENYEDVIYPITRQWQQDHDGVEYFMMGFLSIEDYLERDAGIKLRPELVDELVFLINLRSGCWCGE